jgi:RNA polymerase sigma-70 factor (ECF subfamily)
MSGAALERVFREASGRIVGALAARFRDLQLAEDACAEACARALEDWPRSAVPEDPAAWLYQVAFRVALDAVRRRETRHRLAVTLQADEAQVDAPEEDSAAIPDERLRLIFICCHPAVSVDARAALTLRLVCGLSTQEIARAFLTSEVAMSQRLSRAKRKIADAGVPFETPGPEHWLERLDAVLSTLEIAYAKAHEDAAASGAHARYAAEVLELTGTVATLMPEEAEPAALAALVRFAEARRPARVDADGVMIPISEQNPALWCRPLIDEGRRYLDHANQNHPDCGRVLQAQIHGQWCARKALSEPPPWPAILALYDRLLLLQDDPVVRLNRAVATAEVRGAATALREVEALDPRLVTEYGPYHAVRADLLRRIGRIGEARETYDRAIALIETHAERAWLICRRAECRD